VRLVADALATLQTATLVLYDPNALDRSEAGSRLLAALPDWADRAYEVDGRVLAAAAQTESPAGVVAVLCMPAQRPLSEHTAARFGLILDAVADPGNAGTILRTAAAVGVDYVIAAPGTVDLYAPKVVRAGMGAHFRIPLYESMNWPGIEDALVETVPVATQVDGGDSVFAFVWPQRAALIVGSEAHGLSHEAREVARARVHIPMRPGVESLNASVAASLVMYLALGPSISLTGGDCGD
jgi:TrmH family RNA methyltransferase